METAKAIYLDMDGTFVDLYGVDDWLNYLISEDSYPYFVAKPLVNLSVLARQLNRIQRAGYVIGIVSWCSRDGSEEYNKQVIETKIKWLQLHLPSVSWDEIHIVEYGTPKSCVVDCPCGILFDDEKKNRMEWAKEGFAFDAENLLSILRHIV